MTKQLKRIVTLVLAIIMIAAAAFTSFAASAKISFSDPSANVGEEFEMKVKITGDADLSASSKVTLNYDPAYLEFVSGDYTEGGAGTLVLRGATEQNGAEYVYVLKFKALSAGSTTVGIKDSEIYDSSENSMDISHAGSSTVTIAGETGSSVNANLSGLKISPGVLTPAFTPEVTDYTAVVGEDCVKVAVSAPTADSNAKVVISGNSELQMGENTIECKVTAQDGSTTKTYTIVVTKKEGNVDYGDAEGILHAEVNGLDFEVAAAFDESLLPEDFTRTTYTYKGQEVQAATNANGLLLMYLIGNDGSGDFYIYDESTDTWSPYARINVVEKSITIIPLPDDVEVPEGFAETTLELNGKKVRGWVWATDEEQKYCIVYGMNQDGDRDFYRYDMKEKTIQRYFADPAVQQTVDESELVELRAEYQDLQDAYNIRTYLLLGLAVIAGILLIALILVLIFNRGNGGDAPKGKPKKVKEKPAKRVRREEEYDDYDEYDEADGGYTEKELARSIRREYENRPLDDEETYLRGEEDQRAESYGRIDEPKAAAKASDDDGFEVIDL